MIIRCHEKDKESILSYIGSDYPKCLYLYLDLLKYGFDDPTVEVYSQLSDNNITAVILKYYSCIHVYSADCSFNSAEFCAFIEKCAPTMVYCASDTAEKVYASLPKKLRNAASVSNGWVGRIKKIDKPAFGLAVRAEKTDFDQIVRLIYDDEDIGRSYKFEELAHQLEERSKEGYSRNIVIKQGDIVIAHACTNAEINGIAVVAELLVRTEFRRKGFASEIWRDLCGTLLDEGKEVYSFYYSLESYSLHKKLGFQDVCRWSKIVFVF